MNTNVMTRYGSISGLMVLVLSIAGFSFASNAHADPIPPDVQAKIDKYGQRFLDLVSEADEPEAA